MPQDLVVFIDEAGDEGFNIVAPPAKKASEWFLVGAAVCRYDSLHIVNAAAPDSFHFRKEHHHRRVCFAEKIAGLPLTAMVVLAHKPSIDVEAALRKEKHYLFNYCSKLLLERVSWYCEANSPNSARVIFSRRRSLSLRLFREYLQRMRDTSKITSRGVPIFKSTTSIRWNCIDPESVDMQEADSSPGLRVADAIVSGCARAVEWSPSYTTEHRYVKILKDRFYRSGWRSRCQSYGIKFIPDDAADRCFDPSEPNRFHWLKHFA
jgi:hypothetical protein